MQKCIDLVILQSRGTPSRLRPHIESCFSARLQTSHQEHEWLKINRKTKLSEVSGKVYSSCAFPARLIEVWHAVSFALLDSVNVLLIGVVVALGIMLPKKRSFARTAGLLIAGDWLGVLGLCLIVLLAFDGLGDVVGRFLQSPLFGMGLILVGLASLVLTWRSRPGDNAALVAKVLDPLLNPSRATVVVGVVLGVIQSATSVPFYAGLAAISAGGFSALERYLGLIGYATLALSLPALSAFFVALVRARPNSRAGRAFEWMRERPTLMAKAAGYLVAVLLTAIGAAAFV